jgi:hypothetical protein
MARTVTLTAQISTNPTFSERYFGDLRVGARQNVRYRDAEGIAQFLAEARKAAAKNNITVEFIDKTGELGHIS